MRPTIGKTILKWAAALLLLFILLIVAMRASGKHALRKAYAALEADGRPMTVVEILPPPVAPEDDAAPRLQQAWDLLEADTISSNELAAILGALPSGDSTNTPTASPYEFIHMIVQNNPSCSTHDFLNGITRYLLDNPSDLQAIEATQSLFLRDSVQRALDLFLEAADKKFIRGDIDYKDGPDAIMPPVTCTLFFHRLTACTALLNLPEQEARLWQHHIAALRLAQLSSDNPTFISMIISGAQLLTTTEAIKTSCTTTRPPLSVVKHLQNNLAAFDDINILHHKMDSERLLYLEWIFSQVDGSEFTDDSGPIDSVNDFMDSAKFNLWTWLFKDVDHAVYLMYWQKKHNLLKAPYSSTAFAKLEQWLKDQPSVYFMAHELTYERMAPLHFNTIATSRLMRIGLSASAYQQEHGSYPATIEQMNMQHLLDPFSEKPFIYKPSPDGFLLYSIGPNQLDDAGAEQNYKTNPEDYDIPWHHNVPKI